MKIDFNLIQEKGSVQLAYPDLDRYQEFNGPVSGYETLQTPKLLLYAFLTYHPTSPKREIEDLHERKISVGKLVWGKHFPEIRKKLEHDIFPLLNSDFRDMVTMVLRLGNNRNWERMLSASEAYHHIMQEIRTPITDTDDMDADKKLRAYALKADLIEASKKLNNEITEQEKFFYGGDEDLQQVMEHGNDLEASGYTGGAAERYARITQAGGVIERPKKRE
jgi:hypothetical protein